MPDRSGSDTPRIAVAADPEGGPDAPQAAQTTAMVTITVDLKSTVLLI
jgi:hypothetical protein